MTRFKTVALVVTSSVVGACVSMACGSSTDSPTGAAGAADGGKGGSGGAENGGRAGNGGDFKRRVAGDHRRDRCRHHPTAAALAFATSAITSSAT